MDPFSLATAAVVVLAPFAPKLIEGAAGKIGEGVPEAVGKLYHWLRDKFASHPVAKASLEQMVAQGGDRPSQEMVEFALTQRLKSEPALQDELYKLLPQEVLTMINQTATVSFGSANAQTAGNNNQTTINLGDKF